MLNAGGASLRGASQRDYQTGCGSRCAPFTTTAWAVQGCKDSPRFRALRHHITHIRFWSRLLHPGEGTLTRCHSCRLRASVALLTGHTHLRFNIIVCYTFVRNKVALLTMASLCSTHVARFWSSIGTQRARWTLLIPGAADCSFTNASELINHYVLVVPKPSQHVNYALIKDALPTPQHPPTHPHRPLAHAGRPC